MSLSPLLLVLFVAGGGVLAGLLVWMTLTRRLSRADALADAEAKRRQEMEEELRVLRGENAELGRSLARAQSETQSAEAQLESQKKFLEESRKELENSFRALASSALEGNTRQFLDLAEERMTRVRGENQAELDKRKQAIQELLTPLRDTLVRLESRTGEIEKARVDAYAKIDTHVNRLLEQTVRLQDKTTSLHTALKGSQVRGRWGEIALRNIAELSGMTEHCDFEEQETLAGGKRPDMVVRLPGGRRIAVDAKTPLSAYLASLEAESDGERGALLDRHVADLRTHLKTLAGRDYAGSLDGELDLVVMFLPGDPYLAAAFSRDPDLQTEALRARVLIATPSTLVALLRTVAIYWQQRSMAENAEQIAETARTLYQRATVFAEHLDRVGKGLEGAVTAYNQAKASFERRFLPMAKQLEEMKVTEQAKRTLEGPRKVEEMPQLFPAETGHEVGAEKS